MDYRLCLPITALLISLVFISGCAGVSVTPYGCCVTDNPTHNCTYIAKSTCQAQVNYRFYQYAQCSDVPDCTCSDGTRYGDCSLNRPWYCSGGILAENCSVCGCPADINMDGIINTTDLDIVSDSYGRSCPGVAGCCAPQYPSNWDCNLNDDGEISISDMQLVSAWIGTYCSEIPGCEPITTSSTTTIPTTTTIPPVISIGYVLTDEFDYWEDQTTHYYTCSGSCTQGAYSCGNDKTLRVGSCTSATSWSEITVSVTPDTHSVILRFAMPWSGSPTLYVDDVDKGQLTCSSCSCDINLDGIQSYTADGQLVVKIYDNNPGSCAGNSQIAYLKVYSSRIPDEALIEEKPMAVLKERNVCPLLDSSGNGASIYGQDGGESINVGGTTYMTFGDTMLKNPIGFISNNIASSTDNDALDCVGLTHKESGGRAVRLIDPDPAIGTDEPWIGEGAVWPGSMVYLDPHVYFFYESVARGIYSYEITVAYTDCFDKFGECSAGTAETNPTTQTSNTNYTFHLLSTDDRYHGWIYYPDSSNILWTGPVTPCPDSTVTLHAAIPGQLPCDGNRSNAIGVGLAKFDPSDIMQPLTRATRTGVFWDYDTEDVVGATAVLWNNYVYVFYDLKLARVYKSNIEDKSAYSYWNGDEWVDNVKEAVKLWEQDFINGIGVAYNEHLGKFVAVYTDVFDQAGESYVPDYRIYARTADSPTGPWSKEVMVEDCAEYHTTTGWLLCYTGRQHPQYQKNNGQTVYLTHAIQDEIGGDDVGGRIYLHEAVLGTPIYLWIGPTEIVEVGGDSIAMDTQVSAGADDVTVSEAGFFFPADFAVYSGSLGFFAYHNAYRFNIDIPQGATVNSANLSVHTFTNPSLGINFQTKLSVEDSDNALRITSLADFDRPLTSAQVEWDDTAGWTGNTWYTSPDISQAIQEVVDRSGWVPGNSINVFWKDDGSSVNSYRIVDTFEGGYPAQLKIEYVESSTMTTVTRTMYDDATTDPDYEKFGLAFYASSYPSADFVPIRQWRDTTGNRLYSDTSPGAGYADEGIVFYAPVTQLLDFEPVYEWKRGGNYLYSMNDLSSSGYTLERIAFYAKSGMVESEVACTDPGRPRPLGKDYLCIVYEGCSSLGGLPVWGTCSNENDICCIVHV